MSDTWCRHRTVFDSEKHATCAAGIDYWAFRGGAPFPGWMDNMPCLGRTPEACARCPKYEPEPPEKLAEMERTAELTIVAFSLCLADTGKNPRPHRGTVTCPKCEGTIDYLAKATKTGTIWGKCRTDGCLEWMV